MIPAKPQNVTWTDEQWSAIYEDNKNIIVSAGAGSGKTAVLTERVIRKLKDGINVNELLILTFTKAAAEEMAERIRKKIKKIPELKEQLNLLDGAYITTFDSFSLSIVKKYHYLINVSPNIGIIDASIIDLEKEKIMEEIFLEHYENKDFLFLQLINNFCIKDDKEIKEYLISISNKLDMLSNKEEYLTNYLDNYFKEDKINRDVILYLNLIKEKIPNIKDNLVKISYLNNDYSSQLEESLTNLFNATTYNEIATTISHLKLPNAPRGSEEELKNLKASIGDTIKEIKTLCSYKDEEEIKELIYLTKDNIQVIITLILEFTKRVDAYKYARDCYEFNDIAIMAINILKDNPEVREELKHFFKEIMIDEYQDTNDLQEEFISMIENNNVYMVGDIKQSIYRFRNANPYIFKNKYDTYSNPNNNNLKIDLNKNFRSRQEVLDNINLIFNLVMDDLIGGANYVESHQMIFGNNSYLKEDVKHSNDLEIYNYNYSKELGYNKEEIEAFIVANDIIKKIDSNYLVFDKDEGYLRKINYSDICIIMDRSTDFELYKKIFSYLHIPLSLYKDNSMNNDNDIYVINNIIRLTIKIHNCELDTEFRYLFTSICRSFLLQESDSTIFDYFINNNFKDSNLYQDLLEISKVIDSISITNLLDIIIDKFNYYEKIITITNIKDNLIKLDKIKDMATTMENLGYNIYTFSEYLNNLIKEEYDIKYSSSTVSSNSVKIMTIHKSKGLEYPLCYYTGLYKKFNISDLKDTFLYDKAYGLIVPYFKEGIGETIYKDLLKDKYLKEEISEKIRLFYVALTRAREKMILVMPVSDDYPEFDNTTVLAHSVKETYRSLEHIINSVIFRISDKCINIDLEKENLTKDYNLINIKNYKDYLNNTCNKIIVEEINVPQEVIESTSFSKKTNKLITKEERKKMDLGTSIHEILELIDFNNPDYNLIGEDFYKDKVKKFLESDILKDKSEAKIYKEYEFIYVKDNTEYHGIIDLMLEYSTYIDIIDYKLKNTDDENYNKQLNGYKEYIESITNKKVNIYLYSIIGSEFTKL
jgi:ATP-dependent helicase/nuclease subunit A